MRTKALVVLLVLLLWLGILVQTDAFVVCIVCHSSSLPLSICYFPIVCFLFSRTAKAARFKRLKYTAQNCLLKLKTEIRLRDSGIIETYSHTFAIEWGIMAGNIHLKVPKATLTQVQAVP